ncbi:MAG: glycogen synthase GlgA [Thermodesulfovibrionales bacterium]|nr:glycogen synthase GlgA [Thermodesulfovibrionales bacterium]
MKKRLKVLFVASEAVPFAKEGGLGDVVGTLPRFLKRLGHDVRVVIPRYYKIDRDFYKLQLLPYSLGVPMGIIGTLWAGVYEGKLPNSEVPINFIEFEQYFGRDGLYNDTNGQGFLDNDNRFVFLSRGAIELARMIGFAPDIIHVHDWQTAIIPVYINTIYKQDETVGKAATVLTIHNMQHQGDFYAGLMDVLGVGWEHFNFLELEAFNKVNLLKGGIYHATLLTTVSKTYAQEIQTPYYGYRLEGVVRERAKDLYGILNGVDYEEWNPETDKYIVANYSHDNLEGKLLCKSDLQETMGLPKRQDVPIIGLVSRLVYQKGIDVFAEAIHRLLGLDIQIVMLGTGEPWTHFFFPDMANKHPQKFACKIGYNNSLAHKIEAGADFFLMPSRFEPCGLNQMYSLRYGTLPIVRATGGLNDTVENFNEDTLEGTGFKFYDLTADAIFNTVGWAVHTYYNNKNAMDTLIKRAMQKRFTWEDSAKLYEDCYYKAVKAKRG